MSEMKISVDGAVIQELIRKTNKMIEDTRMNLSLLDQSVVTAEMTGWNDKNYHKFKENFMIAKRNVEEGISLLEEVVLPFLKRTMSNIENFK